MIMIDAILKRYSTLTILDLSCDHEKKLRSDNDSRKHEQAILLEQKDVE